MNKKARVFAYSAIATSLIFESAFISGCGDSGSTTTPAFPASSSTSTPSTEPTPNDPSTPTTPATPSTPNTPNTPNPEQPTEEASRQISLQFDSKSIAELQNLNLPQVAGEALMIRDPYRIGRFDIVQSSEGDYSIKVTIKTANGDVINTSEAFAVNPDRYLWEFSYNQQDNTVMQPTTVFIRLRNSGNIDENTPFNSAGFAGGFDFYPNSQRNYVFDYKTDPEKYVAANCLATATLVTEKIQALLSIGDAAVHSMMLPYELNEEYMKIGDYYFNYSDKYKPSNWHIWAQDDIIVSFPYATNENGQNIYTGASGEIVAGGVGSSILGDIAGITDYPCREALAFFRGEFPCFEEAFKDIVALYMSSQNIDVCRLAVKQCQGNWRKVNCLSSIGEEVGQYNKRDCLRQLINDDKWREGINCDKFDPDTKKIIPSKSEHLTASLIFSGAFYDIMTGIAQRNIDAGMDSAIALKNAGQEAMGLLVNGLQYIDHSLGNEYRLNYFYDLRPSQKFIYRRVAIAMLQMDAKNNGCRATDIITQVMKERKILQEGDNASTIISEEELREML